MKIYADFNGIETCSSSANEYCLDLTGYGTLASLSHFRIKLSRGLILTFVDTDGLTAVGTVDFSEDRVSTRSSGWYAKFKKDTLFDGEPLAHDYDVHECFHCRKNIKAYLDEVGRQFHEFCPYCGTSVMHPLSSPYSD